MDARIVIVLPDRSPWHSLQSKKRDPHDHSDPSQPHRRGRIVAVNTVINTLKKGKATNFPSLHVDSFHIIYLPSTAAAFLIRSLAERQSDLIHYYIASFLLGRTSCFLVADKLSPSVFQKWIRSRR